jgi:negative regulator of flagellin synthesis FlgM
MADKITGYGRTGVDVTSARSRGTVRNERAADGTKGGPASAPEKAAGAVQLTDTATNLQQVEARLASQPDVDRARVDAVRQKVESGNYQVNAGRLADRLLAFERDLA